MSDRVTHWDGEGFWDSHRLLHGDRIVGGAVLTFACGATVTVTVAELLDGAERSRPEKYACAACRAKEE